MHFALGQRLGLDRLLTRIVELPRDDRWQTMARAALRDDLHAVHAQLTAEVLQSAADATTSAKELVAGWEKANAARARVGQDPALDHARSRADLARISVGLRIVRGLLSDVA